MGATSSRACLLLTGAPRGTCLALSAIETNTPCPPHGSSRHHTTPHHTLRSLSTPYVSLRLRIIPYVASILYSLTPSFPSHTTSSRGPSPIRSYTPLTYTPISLGRLTCTNPSMM
ncbi:hypothetical protein BDY19DRAFT_967640 [Irpex rosettiformis]|uniref:Uncharacterized protein n=1 Tax=Irpex rosettiformis TaxID=378272 RepID=A0ACB8TSL9_9APHY|nr:hypothetical protein BDY19DRAFT_967640 [Irpex rosettiformis]